MLRTSQCGRILQGWQDIGKSASCSASRPVHSARDIGARSNGQETLYIPIIPAPTRSQLLVHSDCFPVTRRCTEPVPIEITGSAQYSFGDHPVCLWVSGASGWFEIKPSRLFEPIYREIHEAVTLYYGVFDAYNNHFAEGSKKKGRRPQPSLDTVLLKYALKAGSGIFHEEAKALCHKWADFLIAHFPKEDACNGWSWDNTDFAKWLRDSHPVSI